MDLLNSQLTLYKGSSPIQKAKAHLLQLLQQVEEAHAKLAKLTTKEDLDTFLNKCITAPQKPKLLKTIQDLSVKMEETKELLAEAKLAEEKRQERAAKREAKQSDTQTTQPHVFTPLNAMQAVMAAIGGITVNVNVQNGGAVGALDPKRPKGKTANPGKYKKKAIPKNVRNQTWNHYIGKEKGEAPCTCCGIKLIDKAAFEAGHVVPEVKGGASTIENLRPICGECNRSMGDTDMREYAQKYYGRRI